MDFLPKWGSWKKVLDDVYLIMNNIQCFTIKGAQFNFKTFFQILGDVSPTRKLKFITFHGNFYSCKVFCLADINVNMPAYGNHN